MKKETRLYANEYDEINICQQCIKIVTDNPDQFQKAHDTDGGYDILASKDAVIPARGKNTVLTGLKVAIPRGYVGFIKSRSGLAVKHDIEKGAGTIDCGYTGEIMVVLRNESDIVYFVKAGDKIAQMVIVPICKLPVQLVGSLEDSKRGEKGFNSTGYNHG